MNEYLRRTGKKAGKSSRRGTCRDCRKLLAAQLSVPVRELPIQPTTPAQSAFAEAERMPEAPEAPELADGPSEPGGGPEPEGKPAKAGKKRKRRARKNKSADLPEAHADESLPAGRSETFITGENVVPAMPDEPEAAPAAEAIDGGIKRKKRRRRSRRKTAGQAGAAAGEAPQPAPDAKRVVRAVVPKRVAPIVTDTRTLADASALIPTRAGIIRMRGRTDSGRGWYQEIDPELAVILVREHAAVIVNRHTIKRLYSNKEFRKLILNRDDYTCYFCGDYGDTIDHLLPRAKGGHTTPVNCVCACMLCNQSKADQYEHEFRNGK